MENINNLSLEVLSVATQLMGKVLDALRSGLAALELQGEDVSVVPTAAFFTTLHSKEDECCEKIFMPLQTAVGSLPENFLKKFRYTYYSFEYMSTGNQLRQKLKRWHYHQL